MLRTIAVTGVKMSYVPVNVIKKDDQAANAQRSGQCTNVVVANR